MTENYARDFRELFPCAGFERVLASVKEHIRHVDDKTPGSFPRFQNRVQLLAELFPQLSLFLFGLRGGLASFLRFGLSSLLLCQSCGACCFGLVLFLVSTFSRRVRSSLGPLSCGTFRLGLRSLRASRLFSRRGRSPLVGQPFFLDATDGDQAGVLRHLRCVA